MKAEIGTSSEASPDFKVQGETNASGRARKGKRRLSQSLTPGGSVRFFLAKSDGSGTPSLDREFESEQEAIVESLKTGKHYFVISECNGLADLSKKVPLIRKEAVSHRKTSPI